jgi:predicted unusual protein kinase regulating ubiquinone biosynthesis (AarF/ABC1/UbiB family)
MDPERSIAIENALQAGIRRWPRYFDELAGETPPATQARGVLRPMQRRKRVHDFSSAHVALPMARRLVFRPGVVLPVVRIFVWLWVCIKFFVGNGYERLRGRSSVQRRAQRLREIFEEAGASFSKLGQQMSMRADILPYAYCVELSKMLDRAKPISTDQAVEIIERSLGRPLSDAFAAFDPVPIGAASLATVYQAELKSGERVAVKVRRPGIGPILSADLRALEWLMIAAETLTLIRPGLTRSFRHDLRRILMGELNFRDEARYTEMFRRRAEKRRADVTAPRVFFKYCTDEVMVSELVSGVWMWELMAAVDNNDLEFLGPLAERGIEPRAIASRLVRNVHRDLLEELFFHADPHPANLVVLPDNKICFLDFGAIGRFSTDTRNTWRELHHHMQSHDIGRMVSASMRLVEPLPPIDVVNFMQAVEENYTDWVYANASTDAEWWERSTAQTWLRYINIAREYGVPVSLEITQFFRATLLYDTIATRLNKDIDFNAEYKEYAREAGKKARQRVQKAVGKRLGGPTDNDYLTIEQVGDTVTQFFFLWQRLVEDPAIQFKNIVGKIAYAVSMVVRIGYLAVVVAGFALITDFLAARWFGRQIVWTDVADRLISVWWVQLALLLVAVVLIRRFLIRMGEPDRRPDSVQR